MSRPFPADRLPILTLRQLRIFKAQGKTQLSTATKVDRVTKEEVIVPAATVDSYNPDTGAVVRGQVHEVSVAALTAERARLLADAAEIEAFLATVPKP